MGFSWIFHLEGKLRLFLEWTPEIRHSFACAQDYIWNMYARWTKSELPDGESQQKGLHSFSKIFFSKGHGIATCCKMAPSSKSFSGIFQTALVLQVWMGFSFPISCCLWLLWSFPCVSAFACPCSQHHNDVKRKESPCACQLWAKSQSRQS